MSVSLDRECLRECKNDCNNCPKNCVCSKESCVAFLQQLGMVFLMLGMMAACLLLSIFGGDNSNYKDGFRLAIGIFIMTYEMYHFVLIRLVFDLGVDKLYPDIVAAFPKFRYVFIYLLFVAPLLWYAVLWIPKIVLTTQNGAQYFKTTEIATFVCFMIQYLVEVVFYFGTCCLKFKPSEKGSLNQSK